jgi:malonyl-CoA decarboxylase
MGDNAPTRRRLLDRLRRRARRAPLAVAPTLGGRDVDRMRDAIDHLLARHGTVSQRDEAAAVAETYLTLDDEGRLRFLQLLVRELWTDPAAIDSAIEAVRGAAPGAARRRAERELRERLTPPAARLLHLFTGLDGGVKLLVDLRADLLRLGDDDPELGELDHELRAHFTTLFDVGLLHLRRITWDSPASLLEKLATYEAVHAIGSWEDLKNRLDYDRRCYAFFHPAMPAEPLVFVEVALTQGLATDLTPLLDEEAPALEPESTDTAVFYSISSSQPGLAGVNLGNALLKQVVEELRRELPHLRRFVTLSPIPGFRAWLEAQLAAGTLSETERELLPATPERVLARLRDEEWQSDEAVEPALLALCARYLTTTQDGRIADPVANFHLTNGASVERINWYADPSATGRSRSVGIMASYEYDPERITERAEAYGARGEVAVSDAVRSLLAEGTGK